MTYVISERRADIDVSVHGYSGLSASQFRYNTPSYVGLGVSRPDNATFQLAEGRHYLLFGAIAHYRTAGGITYRETRFVWKEANGVEYGKRGSIRINQSVSITNTNAGIYRDPLYRREAVAFIPNSVISAHVGTFDLTLWVSSLAGSITGLAYGEGAQTETGVIIMSIPA